MKSGVIASDAVAGRLALTGHRMGGSTMPPNCSNRAIAFPMAPAAFPANCGENSRPSLRNVATRNDSKLYNF